METDRGKWVTLTKVEIVIGVLVGAWRHLHAKANGKQDSHGFKGDPWEIDVEGALAELAAYKAIGRYWSPTIDQRKDGTGDGGPYEVRRRSKQWHDHLIREDDVFSAPYILAIGSISRFRIVGWIYCHEARRDEWWDNKDNRGWAWWPPQEKLHDLDELPVL